MPMMSMTAHWPKWDEDNASQSVGAFSRAQLKGQWPSIRNRSESEFHEQPHARACQNKQWFRGRFARMRQPF